MKTEKKDTYEKVTNTIIEMIENGELTSWSKGWGGASSGAFNRVTKKPYSILNQILLNRSGEWATFKQWSELGGKIKKGAKSKYIVFFKFIEKEKVNEETGEKEVQKIPFLNYYNVFHISQVENVTPLEEVPKNEFEVNEELETVLNDYYTRENIKVKHKLSNEAFYTQGEDAIYLPLQEQFKNYETYAETKLHETVHSSGHQKRLNRLSCAKFGSEKYSKEELIAEMGASFLMNIFDIDTEETIKNNASYLKSWLEVLKNDTKMIVSAATKAEKAVKYILNIQE
ncbi:MAG: zincin-like metallopeptidase domain-containing protein [bacterium]|nr:zincin-like metallopeptidase domain-containing protein [bacterium]